jgi:hypothetical protein
MAHTGLTDTDQDATGPRTCHAYKGRSIIRRILTEHDPQAEPPPR